MQPNQPNSIKNNLFRVTAVVITLCYILGPAELPISKILHNLSHHLQAPSYVLQHDFEGNHIAVNKLHIVENKNSFSSNHQHNVIDFIDEVLNNSSNEDKNHQGESILDLKINKHITSNKYILVFQNNNEKEPSIYQNKSMIFKSRYLDQLYKPPIV
ncbi:hypothetical protein [uncultured Winogradskyella sp.]|uniref:hypothetical protein n=1 Tax=uncultured Winogradskyella sp. TaxID=395353 RepID=UPI002637E873|nr:hypothetical protein [uncultured Winogradskyella sp.]